MILMLINSLKPLTMKQLVTLALSFFVIATGFAQTSAEREEARRIILGQKKGSTPESKESRDVILGGDNRRVYDERYPESYPNSGSSRSAEVEGINREYDAKIQSIRYNNSLSAAEKERIIRNLQKERQRKIRQVNERYNGDRDDDDRDGKKYKKDKKQKSNNGKHLGWEKGKGNPHKNGGTPGKGKGKKS